MDSKEKLIKALEKRNVSFRIDTSDDERIFDVLEKTITDKSSNKFPSAEAFLIIYDDQDECLEMLNICQDNIKAAEAAKKNYDDKKGKISLEELIECKKIKDEWQQLAKQISSRANKRYDEYKKIIVNKRREENNAHKSYNYMVDILKREDIQYLNMSDILKNVKTNDDLTYWFKRFILLNNEGLLNKVCDENKAFSTSSKDEMEIEEKMTALFAEYGLRISEISATERKKLYQYGNVKKIKEIFEQRKNNGELTFFRPKFPHFVDVLILSSEEIFSHVGIVLHANNINPRVFNDNPYIFVKDAQEINGIVPKYELFISNVNLLKSYNVDISNLSVYDCEVLVSNNAMLLKQLELLKRYNIDFSKIFNPKNTSDFELLRNPLVFDIIDIYIESGLGNYILSHPYLLRNDMKSIAKRVFLCSDLNMPIFDDKNEMLSSIKKGDNFIATDEEIDESLSYGSVLDTNLSGVLSNSDCNHILGNIEALDAIKVLDDRYMVSDLIYSFNGILISRLKVLRNMTSLIDKYGLSVNLIDYLKASIMYKSYLSEEKADFINDEIKELAGNVKIK